MNPIDIILAVTASTAIVAAVSTALWARAKVRIMRARLYDAWDRASGYQENRNRWHQLWHDEAKRADKLQAELAGAMVRDKVTGRMRKWGA